jgi:predicted DNA-binding WGR domain protein
MKTNLEYVHDSKNSKVWIIELKNKTITVLFGKKNSTLNEITKSYQNQKEAKEDYESRIIKKLKQGYQKINTLSLEKKSKSKSDKILKIQTISSYINDLLKFTNTIGDKQNKIIENMEDKSYEEYMKKYYDKHFVQFNKVINKYQTKKIGSFIQSGIIVKHIPTKMAKSILEQVNLFANSIDIDYHPNSDKKVRDIIHPSIYPLIIKTTHSNKKTDYWNRPYEDSDFQWLPSEFDIDIEGKCKIKSYINNLSLDHIDLYKKIEKIFEFVLPQLEDVWSWINSIKLKSEDFIGKNIMDKLKKHELKNKTLQVITKIVTIDLNSKQDLIGAWHIEGMPHENIVATASCTLYQESNFEGSILFKRVYTAQEEDYIRMNMQQDPIKEVSDLVYNQHVPIGKVNLSENTLIVFPNSHVHKVDMFNTGSKKQSRTIIVFWLINPNIKIKSTKDIEQQKYSINIAHRNRLMLMKERTIHKQTFNQRDINLCEH